MEKRRTDPYGAAGYPMVTPSPLLQDLGRVPDTKPMPTPWGRGRAPVPSSAHTRVMDTPDTGPGPVLDFDAETARTAIRTLEAANQRLANRVRELEEQLQGRRR